MPLLSIIIPLAPGERSWHELVRQLRILEECEIILTCGEYPPEVPDEFLKLNRELRVITGGKGRAGQMNVGAEAATSPWLWFLHADSRLADNTLETLKRCMQISSPMLFYFDLRFLDDGPAAMRLNERAVKWRSDVLKIPFGDQGFLLRKDLFENLGHFREDLTYGEDHVFVWKARQEDCAVSRTGGDLFTSARKYQSKGWFFVTFQHVWLTIAQAVPQWLLLQKARLGRMWR